jgi:hypothetical protein
MRNLTWVRNGIAVVLVAALVLLVSQAGGVRAQIPDNPAPVSDTYKSLNGKYAVRVEESVKTQGHGSAPTVIFRMLETNVTGLAVAEDGAATEQWKWSISRAQSGIEMAIAGALAADSGKLFVVARFANRNPLNADGTDMMAPPIVLLDDKGKSLAGVAAGDWWRALEKDGEMTRAKPPSLRLLDNEKVLEIKLASGKIARVKTDTGELTVEQSAAPAVSTAGAESPFTKENARMAVQLAALKSPNPFVREMAYHDHDADWSFALKAGTFSVKSTGLQGNVFRGKLQSAEKGTATATFDDEPALSRNWIVPADTVLTAEEATRCLAAMGERLTDPDPSNLSDPNFLKTLCAVMKGVEPKVDAATGQMTGAGRTTPLLRAVEWRINLRARTFEIHSAMIGNEPALEVNYSGRFGWDKNRQWTAWPIEMTSGNRISINGGAIIGRLRVQPAIPAQNLALGKPAFASSSLEGHAAAAAVDGKNSTFWQPAADDAQPTWTVDLQALVSLAKVSIIYPVDVSRNVDRIRPTLETSDDQKTWHAVPDPAAGSSSFPITYLTNATARYVRLSFPAPAPAMGRGRTGGGPVSRTLQIPEVVIDGT